MGGVGRAGLRLGWALVLGLPGCGGPEVLTDCRPQSGLTPVCLFHAPEDLAVVGHWLLVSQMPSASRPGSLVAYHPETTTLRRLYPPPEEALPAAESATGACAPGVPPPASDFAPHGIDVREARLLVVNHGRREAIEEFELGADATGLTLVWKSCTPLPADASANDVVALPDGGFAATKMVDRPQWKGIAKLLLGLETGELLRFVPSERAWQRVAQTSGRAPNGVEVEADGTFWISEWSGRRVVRIEPDGSGKQLFDLDFSPDNLAWAADGRLLVAGQRGGVLDVPACARIEQGACGLASVVVAIDPVTGAIDPIVEEDPAIVLGAASIAVELDGQLWIGAFAGDRLVSREGGSGWTR